MKEVSVPGVGVFEFPDEATQQQIESIMREKILPQFGIKLPTEGKSGFMPALRSGIDSAQGSLQSALGGIADAVGAQELRDSLYKQAQANRESADSELTAPTNWEDVSGAYDKSGLMAALGKFPAYAAEGIGKNLPQMAVPVIAPIAGGIIGTAMGGPAGAALGVGAGMAAGFGSNMGLMAGQNIQRQMDEGVSPDKVGVGKAFSTAVPQAALETIADRVIAGPLARAAMRTPISKMISTLGRGAEAAAEESVKRVLVRTGTDAVKHGAKAAAAESVTEAAQQGMERAQAMGIDSILTPEGLDEMRRAAIEGGILGGLMGGAAGPFEGVAARRDLAARKEQQEAKARLDTQTGVPIMETSPAMGVRGFSIDQFGGDTYLGMPKEYADEAEAQRVRAATGVDPSKISVNPPVEVEEEVQAPAYKPPQEGLEAARINRQRQGAATLAGDPSKISTALPEDIPEGPVNEGVAPFLPGKASLSEEETVAAPRGKRTHILPTPENLEKYPEAAAFWADNKSTAEELTEKARKGTVGVDTRIAEGAVHQAFTDRGGSIRKLITVSLQSNDPKSQVKHEWAHVLWPLLTKGQKALLAKSAIANDVVTPERIQRYADLYGMAKKQNPKFDLQDAMNDELSAHLLQAVEAGKVKLAGSPRNILESAQREVQKLGNSLRGLGYQQTEDVIADMESGEIGMRELTGMPTRPLGITTDDREKDKISDDSYLVQAEDVEEGKDVLDAVPEEAIPVMSHPSLSAEKADINPNSRASLNFEGYWVKPDGDSRKLRDIETHPQLAGRILRTEFRERNTGDPEGKLMDKGWVRVRSSAVDFNDGVSFEALASGVNKAVEHAKKMRKDTIQAYKRSPDENELAGYRIDPMMVPISEIPEFLDDPKKYLAKSKMRTFSRSRASLSEGKPLAPAFFSQLERTVVEKLPEKAFPPQIRAVLDNPQNRVKQEELKWSGLDQWLEKQGGRKISKEEIQDYLQKHQIEVEEVVKDPSSNSLVDGARYEQYKTPGGDNYRELLLTIPTGYKAPKWEQLKDGSWKYGKFSITESDKGLFYISGGKREEDSDSLSAAKRYVEDQHKKDFINSSMYSSGHWSEPNVLAHVRFDDRTIDGKKSLLIEEIQSDWHQRGRKEGYRRKGPAPTWSQEDNDLLHKLLRKSERLGFSNNSDAARAILANDDWVERWEVDDKELISIGNHYRDVYADFDTVPEYQKVPDAPFKTTWHELSFKRMLRWAAENGYDRVAWTTGKVQSDRYDLSKKVSYIDYKPGPNNTVALGIVSIDGDSVPLPKPYYKIEELPNVVGKDIADKIANGEGDPGGGRKTLRGVDLKVGGEGMKGFYDKILPEFVNKYAKKWGARSGDTRLTPEGIPVHFVDVTPAMKQSVLFDGQARFSLSEKPISGEIPEADRSRYAMVAASSKPKTLVEKVFGVKGEPSDVPEKLRDALLDQWQHIVTMGERLKEKGHGELTRADRSAEVAVRLGVDRHMQHLGVWLTRGPVAYDSEEGTFSARRNEKRQAVFQSGKVSHGLIRDLTVSHNGKDINLFNLAPDDLVKTQNLWQAVRLDPKRYGRQGGGVPKEKWGQYGKDDWYFQEADKFLKANPWALEMMDKYNEHNKALVKLLQDTGVISEKTAEIWNSTPYSPFYRNLEELEKENTFQKTPSLKNVKFGHAMKGGDAPVDDLVENIVKNMSAAIGASTRNVMMKRLMRDASVLGEVTPVPARAKAANPVTIRVEGRLHHFDVKDERLLKMLQSKPQFDSAVNRLIAESAGWLRKGVTLAPPFWVFNVIRDTGANMLTSGYDISPLRTAVKGIRDSFLAGAYTFAGKDMKETPYQEALYDAGISGGINAVRGDGKTKVNLKKLFKRTSRESFGEDLLSGKFFDAARLLAGRTMGAAEAASDRSDIAVRAKVYEMSGKSNLGRPGAEAQALLEALETLNFSRHGSDPSARWVAMAVPFMNARFQGSDVIQRAARGKAANQLKTASGKAQTQATFMKMGFGMIASSLAYSMTMPFFSAYRNANDEERDGYWFIPLDFTDPESVCVRIPIPFEVGAIFKALPERLWNLMADQKEDGSGGQDLRQDFAKFMIRTFFNTFELNPIPQIMKPLVEVKFNQNFYQGRKIEPAYLEGLAPEYRYTDQTSEASKLISKAIGGAASPVQVDHLIRGYFGSIGSYLVDLSGTAIELAEGKEKGEKPDPPYGILGYKYGMGRFYQRPDGSGKINKFYSAADDVSQMYQSYTKLLERGDYEEAAKVAERAPEKIAANDYFSSLKQALGEIRKNIRVITSDKTMSGEEKADRIQEMRSAQIKLVEDINRVRREIRNQ